MTAKEIHAVCLPQGKKTNSLCLMDQEIAGTRVNGHTIMENDTIRFSACREYIRILFVCSGEVTIQNADFFRKVSGRGVFVGKADDPVMLTAKKDAQILEVCRWLEPDEFDSILANSQLPYCMEYSQAPRYTEDCKSPKTISRMLVPQRLIPRFAMGSVETYGKDRIEKHSHPFLEQFFFGLEENHCIALIEDVEYPFLGNMLLHIPLGSNHGVHLEDAHTCHYLWMDFLSNEDALQYMDQAHQMVK